MSDSFTLDAEDARIDFLGQPLLRQLSVRSAEPRVALLGDWSALFRLLSGEAKLSAGRLLIDGAELPLAVERGRVGLMRLDPVLPGAWSTEQLLSSSAELAGMSRKASARAAFQALERLGLGALASRRLAHLQLAERRAVLVAHAVLTDPRALCLEQPLLGLDAQSESFVLAVVERAVAGRRLLLALGDGNESPGARQLRLGCSAHLRLIDGVIVGDAPSPTGRHVAATVCRNHEAFARALAARGVAATPTHAAGILSVLTSSYAGPCWRYVIDLGSAGSSTAPVLDAALETEAGLVELIPAR